MSPIHNDDSLLVKCECNSHILEIVNDNYFESEGLFYVSVWSQYPNSVSFKDRLKSIWKLIRGKNLDGGDVVITQSDATDIVNFLTKKLAENKSKAEFTGFEIEKSESNYPINRP